MIESVADVSHMETVCDALVDLILTAPSAAAWSEAERATMRNILRSLALAPESQEKNDYIVDQFAQLPPHVVSKGWALVRLLNERIEDLVPEADPDQTKRIVQ